MEYFKTKRKNKAESIDYLMENARAVFTSHIPVYSTKLRHSQLLLIHSTMEDWINKSIQLSHYQIY